MKRLGVLTTGRQDWSILRKICRLVSDDPALELRLIAGGMALSEEHGMAVRAMEADGLPPDARLDWLQPEATVSAQAGKALERIGEALQRLGPEALLVVGDRFETMSGVLAATVLRIPVVHLHGGEETEGAFDNAIRHAITKLAHLHLVSHAEYGRRVVAMGEDPGSVHVVGAPGLDTLASPDRPSKTELEQRLGISLDSPLVTVTVHPATLGEDAGALAASVCEAMDRVEATYVITLPNNDPGAESLREALRGAAKAPRRVAVESLGRLYATLLHCADAMLGNSSSGIIEAPALGLPVVNVGTRQQGRLRAPNVIDVGADADAIVAALERALDPAFRLSVGPESRAMFGDGRASERVVEILRAWKPPSPPIKRWSAARP